LVHAPDGWLFAVRYETRMPPTRGAYVTKGERFAPEDLLARVPRLRPISSRPSVEWRAARPSPAMCARRSHWSGEKVGKRLDSILCSGIRNAPFPGPLK